MKSIIIIIMIILSFCFISCMAIAEKKIIGLVLRFDNGVNNLSNNTKFNIKKHKTVDSFGNRKYYYSCSIAKNDFLSWDINESCNEIIMYYDYLYVEDNTIITQNYTQTQCYNKALSYVREKYNNFDNFNMTLEETYFDNKTCEYYFTWKKIINNIITNNSVRVIVSANTCNVSAYVIERGPYENIPTVNISYGDLIDLVVNDLGVTQDISYTIPFTTFLEDGNVYWQINIEGLDNNNKYKYSQYYINANNGNIRIKNTVFFKKDTNKTKYISVNDYLNEINGELILLNDKAIKIKVKNKEYELNIDSEYVEYKDVKGKLGSKVKKEKDIIYIPDSIYRIIE